MGLATLETFDALLYSTLAGDDDLAEIIALFIDEIPGRIGELETAVESEDWAAVARLAHQLKGAGGSYGIELLSQLANQLELAARRPESQDDIRDAMAQMADASRRIRHGASPA